jgi:hypothetical protein
MAQYVSGRQPFLNVGIPGITTNTPVLDITGRVGIGTTNPSADLDLSTLRIRQSISDVNNFSGELGYFLSKDAVGLKWVGVSAVNNNALFVAQNSVFSGVSSYTGLNFISDANDLVAISTNINPNIVDVKINSYWIKSGNTGIYTSKFVGIGSTTPTVALDVIGGGKFTGVVTAGKFSGQSGIITGNVEVGSFIVTGISTFVGVTTFSKVGIGSTTIPRAILDVGGDVWVSGALTAISITADNFFGTISTSKYADSAGFTTSISLGSTTSTDDTSYLVLVGSSGTTIQQAFIDSQSLSYDGQTNTLNSDNIKVGFITATNAWIGVATINDLKVVNDTFRVGTAITMGNGIITATTFSGKFLDFENLRVSGISTFTNGPVLIGGGTSTGTAGQVLQISGINSSVYIGGNVGLGTTNPTSKLFVVGGGYFTGVITASEFKGNASTSGYASTAGIATYATKSGIATFATDAGISTNLKGGAGGSLPYQSSSSTTAFLANGSAGNILQSNGGTNAPSWESPQGLTIGYANTAGISTFATKAGIATYTSEWILGANGISDYTFTGPGLIGAENDPVLYLVRGQQYKFTNTMGAHPFRIQSTPGISGTVYSDGIVNNGVSNETLSWDVQFDAPGLLYYQCTVHGSMGGKIYIIDAGIGPDISINTTGIITANSLVGTALSISGISTFGGSNGVVIKLDGSNGIVTSANPGFSTVTYYGDGSKLTGIGTAASATNVALTTDTSSTTTNIVFSQTPNQNPTSSLKTNPGLIFNASTSSLGIGTTTPTEKLQVNGNISINGTTSYGSVTATTATVSQTAIHSGLSTSTYRSVEYTIQATRGTNFHATKILSIHDGTTAHNSEYGIIHNNATVGVFDVDISGGNIRLLVTPASSSLITYTINFVATKI